MHNPFWNQSAYRLDVTSTWVRYFLLIADPFRSFYVLLRSLFDYFRSFSGPLSIIFCSLPGILWSSSGQYSHHIRTFSGQFQAFFYPFSKHYWLFSDHFRLFSGWFRTWSLTTHFFWSTSSHFFGHFQSFSVNL